MRTRMHRGAVVALTTSALFLTAACGGSSEKDDKPKAAESGSSAEQKPAEKPAVPLTEAQMKAGLLEVADLPAGWQIKTVPVEDVQAKAEKPECQPLAQVFSSKVEGATAGGSREFSRSGHALAQRIFTFSDGAAAAAFVQSVTDAAAACRSFAVVQDGEKMALTSEKLTVPQVGEGATGVRIVREIPELKMKIETDVLVARQGAGATYLAYVPMDLKPGAKPDHSAFEDLAKRGGDKFAKGAQG